MTRPFEESPTAATDQFDLTNDSAFPALPTASKRAQTQFVPKVSGKITERFEIPALIQVTSDYQSDFDLRDLFIRQSSANLVRNRRWEKSRKVFSPRQTRLLRCRPPQRLARLRLSSMESPKMSRPLRDSSSSPCASRLPPASLCPPRFARC